MTVSQASSKSSSTPDSQSRSRSQSSDPSTPPSMGEEEHVEIAKSEDQFTSEGKKESRREETEQNIADNAERKTIKQEKENGEKDQLEDLDWFLQRSQGFSGTIMDQLKQALEARKTQTSAQPKLVTGGTMRDYQLEGLTWLTCLYQIGLNGILADEMGLGKTIQLISFLAFLREHGTNGPFLILGPLSTVTNWVKEFKFWTPDIPVIMYHGTPQVRTGMRRKEMRGNARGEKFPVVCTSYEICMKDKKFLASYPWKFIVVDEGHRLKNFNCKLVRELKQYPSESRLILTGTPLQNNLTELWSLLNFLLPEAFSDLEQFESMFDFSDVQDKEAHRQFMSKERQQRTVASLHAILKPFLLRRVKTDVELGLPQKREYILYAPLTEPQKEIYRKIKDDDIRSYLEGKAVERISHELEDTRVGERKGSKRKATSSGTQTPIKSLRSSRGSTPASSVRSTRSARKGRKSYEEVSDTQYFKELEQSDSDEEAEVDSAEEAEKQDAQVLAKARKEVNAKALQNPVMQLRLVCNSPHHFSWPWGEEDPDESLVTASGKMLMLDRLVPYLFKHGHKVILFSQFSKQLDILEEWAATLRKWPVCRIDGSISSEDREANIEAFNTRKDHKLFLLSTRAGGLGINLTSADTVILFDSDWNPQQDLQAQDRAHRIGQTRPVIVYRLATKGTVEQMLLEKADGKRRLEKLVIQKDKFRSILDRKTKKEELDQVRDILETDDFENYDPAEHGGEMLSDADLKILTDRSDAAYKRAEKGDADLTGHASGKFRSVETKKSDANVLGSLG